MAGLLDYLHVLIDRDGSDLYLATGAPPSIKVMGELMPITESPLPSGRVKEIAYEIMDEGQIADYETKPEMNLAISQKELGRFRVNIFQQRNETSIVIRSIKTNIPNFSQLGLPPVLPQLVMQKRGLLLFVGATGSGKSTSLASLIDYRNSNSHGHIITIEDPVEFVHSHKKSIVNQREVGIDTDCYEDALQNTLRQAPDVILIGEIRSRETMEHALAFAETGHLCLSTLHANNSNQALDRIINFFPEERHSQLFLDMSLNLRGIVSQRLVPTVEGGRAVAIEILTGTPRVQDLIKKGEVDALKEVMGKSKEQGMQTFDQALLKLYKAGKISMSEALKNADSSNNLRLQITLSEKEAQANGDKSAQQENEINAKEEQKVTVARIKAEMGSEKTVKDNLRELKKQAVQSLDEKSAQDDKEPNKNKYNFSLQPLADE